jgi:hypothetical protein
MITISRNLLSGELDWLHVFFTGGALQVRHIAAASYTEYI